MVVVLIDYKIVSKWFPVLMNRLRIVSIDLALIVISFRLIAIANKIATSGSGINSSWDCSRVVPTDSQENLSCT